MTTPLTVESCDIARGRITFTEDTRSQVELGSLKIIVSDHSDVEHEVVTEVTGDTLTFRLDQTWNPIRALRVTDGNSHEDLFSADNLCPRTNKEFEQHFKSARDRSGHVMIDRFVASQIFYFLDGEEGYRTSAAVVAAYKAIELRDEKYLQDAEMMLLKALANLPNVKMARSARNNREHLHVSVLCTLYHVYLAQGSPREFVQTIVALDSLLAEKNFSSFFNLAFNAALSLRLVTALYRAAGKDEESRRASLLAFDIFKLSARDADNNMAHFKELRYVHDNTYDAMRIGRRMKTITEGFAEKTFRDCLRVSSKDHPEAYEDMLQTFRDAIELLRST